MGATQSELDNYQDIGPPVTDERMLRVLQNVTGSANITNLNVESKPGTEKGDGFSSIMDEVRVTADVDGERKEYIWMVKSPAREAQRFILMNGKIRGDERECFVYNTFFPRLHEFASKKSMSNLVPGIVPIHLAAYNERDKLIVMDHGREIGFNHAINKNDGLDLLHLNLVMKWLGQYHALTHSYIHQYGGGLEQFKKDMPLFFGLFDDICMNPDFESYFNNSNSAEIAIAQQVEDAFSCEGEYVPKLEKISQEHGCLEWAGMKLRRDIVSNNSLTAISHGDTWFNNMLFRYNEDDVEEVKLVDFQAANYVSVVTDLSYFLFSSSTGLTRRDHLDDILHTYHDTLCDTAQQLGSPISYSFQHLKDDFFKVTAIGLAFAISALPMLLGKKEDMWDMGELAQHMGDEETMKAHQKKADEKQRKITSKNMVLLQRMKDVLDSAIEYGCL